MFSVKMKGGTHTFTMKPDPVAALFLKVEAPVLQKHNIAKSNKSIRKMQATTFSRNNASRVRMIPQLM